jgi:DNA helicase-2/ATP-dependent DNA helicase PcrA
LQQFADACRAHELQEERRLAYVACTRARQTLVASAYWWGPKQVRMRGPSLFLDDVIAGMASRGATPEISVPQPPERAQNPLTGDQPAQLWPVDPTSDERDRRRAAAELVRQARAAGWQQAADTAGVGLAAAERAEVAGWDVEMTRLIEEAEASTAREVVVPLPRTLSATTVLRLRDDPDSLARDLARPMPAKPSAAARFGTRFHAWVEAHVGQQQLLAIEDLPGRADDGIVSDADLRQLTGAFAAGPFGGRTPVQVEAPFTLVLGGRAVRGRIDAVYQTDGGYLVVDWKTQQAQTADPLQLGIYRVAWAELSGVELDAVRAAFYYVRSGDVVEHHDLPGRVDLERLLSLRTDVEPAEVPAAATAAGGA